MIDKDYYFSLCRDAEINQASYIEKSKSQILRWEYTGWKRYDTTPYWFERNLMPQSPLMQSGSAITYGFDANDNIAYIQSRQEACFERTEDRLINRVYGNGKVDSIEEVLFVDGYPVKYVEFIVRNGMNAGQEWHFEEEYAYDEKKLVKIKRTEYWYAGNSVRNSEFQIEYDQLGNLSLIKENGAVIYSNIRAEQAREIRDEVKTGLVVESVNTIKRIGEKVGDDLVCFIGVFLHDEPFGPINPIFHSGLQSNRDEQLQAEEDLWTLWNAGEHPQQYQGQLSDDNLIEKFKLLMQYWQMKSDWSNEPHNPELRHITWWGESKAIWQEVAMELNAINWDEIIPATESFVIFADEERLDVAGGDLVRNVPAKKLRILENMGLLSS